MAIEKRVQNKKANVGHGLIVQKCSLTSLEMLGNTKPHCHSGLPKGTCLTRSTHSELKWHGFPNPPARFLMSRLLGMGTSFSSLPSPTTSLGFGRSKSGRKISTTRLHIWGLGRPLSHGPPRGFCRATLENVLECIPGFSE